MCQDIKEELRIKNLGPLNDVDIYVYEPDATHTFVTPILKETPKMTPARAALVTLADFCQNNIFDPSITLLKIHKVLYFLQNSGEPLRLEYKKSHYGPYAENLRHVLKNIEGHFLSGFKIDDEKPNRVLRVLPDGLEQAQTLLMDYPETARRIERVKDLLEGFESTNGMELLASVHYVNHNESAKTAEKAYDAIRKWSTRKSQIFTQSQVANAFAALKDKGWLTLA